MALSCRMLAGRLLLQLLENTGDLFVASAFNTNYTIILDSESRISLKKEGLTETITVKGYLCTIQG